MLSKLRESQEKEEGFTLIELLVVVIIIGILAAIAIPAFLNQRQGAYQSAADAAVRNAAMSVEAVFTQTQAYPADDAAFDALPDVNPGPNVTLTYTRDASGNSFTIVADHALLTPAADATYDSANGGLQ